MASPIPRIPPVTRATCPVMSAISAYLLWCSDHLEHGVSARPMPALTGRGGFTCRLPGSPFDRYALGPENGSVLPLPGRSGAAVGWWLCQAARVERAAETLHRLTSMGPYDEARAWDPPDRL